MSAEDKERLLRQILAPQSDYGADLLNDLGLGGIPSREQVHNDIEEKLLLPKERLPDHWLPTYQM